MRFFLLLLAAVTLWSADPTTPTIDTLKVQVAQVRTQAETALKAGDAVAERAALDAIKLTHAALQRYRAQQVATGRDEDTVDRELAALGWGRIYAPMSKQLSDALATAH